jgi:excisionase family DNA binding protein
MTRVQSRAPVRLLSVEEVAELLQVPVNTIYRWRFRGEGPTGMRIGRYLRFDPRDVASWLEARKAAL